MTCNEARRLITAYVKKELPDRELEQFLYHVEHCSDCMDELDTYYTVYQALDLLDSGGCHNYDFRNMLKNEIRATKKGILRRKIAGILLGILVVAAELLLAVSVYTGYEIDRGAQQSTLIERAILHMNYRGQKIPETEEVSESERKTMEETEKRKRKESQNKEISGEETQKKETQKKETQKKETQKKTTTEKAAQEIREKVVPQKQTAADRMKIEEEQIVNGRKNSTD